MSGDPSGYDVGYGRPPRDTRFRKGQSGNPRGRPNGSESLARLARRVLNEKIAVRENGKRRTISKLEAVLKQLTNKGVSGDLRAIRELLKLPVETEKPDQIAGRSRPTVSAEPLSDEQWERQYGRTDPSKAGIEARRAAARAAIEKAFGEIKPDE
jgi:Family of unknown function (DUF5681)